MTEFDGSNKVGLILEKLCIDPFSIHRRTDGNHTQINLDDPEVVDFALKHKTHLQLPLSINYVINML